jgi:hypothetical protein
MENVRYTTLTDEYLVSSVWRMPDTQLCVMSN